MLVALFLVCALPTGIFLAILTPPGQVPDEPAHLIRAAGLLHGAILPARKMGKDDEGEIILLTGFKVDAGLLFESFGQVTKFNGRPVVTADDMAQMRQRTPDHQRIFMSVPNTATYFPLTYAPATLGLGLGFLLKASPYVCLKLGRIFMLLAFLSLGAGALWIAAFGEALLLAVLLLPMTLFLAGSLNQDGVLIGLICFAAAALTRAPALRWSAAIAFVAFLSAKPPYLPLLGFIAFPWLHRGFWQRAKVAVLAALPVLLWVIVVVLLISAPFGRPAYHPGPLWSGVPGTLLHSTDPTANLHILLTQPSRFITLPWSTAVADGLQPFRELIGVLGQLQISLPASLYRFWAVALLTAISGLFFNRTPQSQSRGVTTVTMLIALILLPFTYWAVMIATYVNWVDVGNDYIDGLQGRYIIPLLPFIAFAVPVWRRINLPSLLPALPALALGMFDMIYLPLRFVMNYDLHRWLCLLHGASVCAACSR